MPTARMHSHSVEQKSEIATLVVLLRHHHVINMSSTRPDRDEGKQLELSTSLTFLDGNDSQRDQLADDSDSVCYIENTLSDSVTMITNINKVQGIYVLL